MILTEIQRKKDTQVIMKKTILLILMVVITIPSCGNRKTYSSSRFLMGTLVTITVMDTSSQHAGNSMDAAFGEIARIEGLMSPYREQSDVYRLNHAPKKGSDPVRISEETFSLVKEAIRISDQTNGCFDITYASVSDLWDFSSEQFSPPARKKVRSRMKAFNYKNISLKPGKHAVELHNGASVGLGGIAKGYAIRMAIHVLRENNIQDAIVEAGGDIQVTGHKNGTPWKIGIRHPRKKGDIIGTLAMEGMDSIATSGDYERFRMYNGKRYHHILDPETGYPAESDLVSVSAITKDPVDADALATALFVMGHEKGMKYVQKQHGLSAIFITPGIKIYASRDLAGRVHFFEAEKITWF